MSAVVGAEDHPPRGGLLRDHDFRHLWAADAISQVGTRVSALAVPVLALLTLESSDNATMNFLYWGVASVGSLGAGLLAGTLSVRGTLWLAAAGMVLAGLTLVFSPLRTMRDLPDITGY